MWTIAEVKARARAAFKANYWPCVGVALLAAVSMGNCNFRINAGQVPWTSSSPSVCCDAEPPSGDGDGSSSLDSGAGVTASEGGEEENLFARTGRSLSGRE